MERNSSRFLQAARLVARLSSGLAKNPKVNIVSYSVNHKSKECLILSKRF